MTHTRILLSLIGTLVLLVAYVLATIGCIKLLFVDRRMAVPMWEVVIPLAAPHERRHWHTGCWHGEQRRQAGNTRRR